MRERLGHVRKTETGTVELPTVEDTMAFGERLGRQLRAGDVVVLSGPLGAGKTAHQGNRARHGRRRPGDLAHLRAGPVHRPRGTGRPALVHVDVYRLLDRTGAELLGELDSLDLDTDLEDAVVVVEWGEGLAERLSDNHLDISLQRCVDTDVRIAHWQWNRA